MVAYHLRKSGLSSHSRLGTVAVGETSYQILLSIGVVQTGRAVRIPSQLAARNIRSS